MPDLTAAQTRQWGKVVKSATALNMRNKALGFRAKNLIDIFNIARQGGVDLPRVTEYLQAIHTEQDLDRKIQLAIGAVMTHDLGIRFRGGDIDIMAPPGTSDDELAQYQGLGVVLILTGIVVVASIAWTLAKRHDQVKLIQAKYIPLIRYCENVICADPTSDMCRKYMQHKQSIDFKSREYAARQSENGADTIMNTLHTGVKWGIAIAIPLIVIFLSSAIKKGFN